MKIYFTAAISQHKEFGAYYQRIKECLEKSGHVVVSGNLFRMTEKTIASESEKERLRWYETSLKNINRADLVVVEISFPSTVNVGHELSVALDKGKPVVALFRDDRDPIFLRGRDEDKLYIFPYNEDDLENVIRAGIEYASEQQDTRFNFFISPAIGNYLDWIAKKRKLPRAVYLRKLIEEDMKNNKEYEKAG